MVAVILAALDSADDRSYMSDLYEQFHRLMFSVAKQYCPQRADWEDVVQDSLIRLMGHVRTLRTLDRCALASYIVITVRNTCYTKLTREKKVLPFCVSLDEGLDPCGEAAEGFAAELIERLDREALVERLWKALTPEERFLLECKYILGYSDKELARYLECKSGSTRMKLTRVRRKALGLLKEWEEEAHEAE